MGNSSKVLLLYAWYSSSLPHRSLACMDTLLFYIKYILCKVYKIYCVHFTQNIASRQLCSLCKVNEAPSSGHRNMHGQSQGLSVASTLHVWLAAVSCTQDVPAPMFRLLDSYLYALLT